MVNENAPSEGISANCVEYKTTTSANFFANRFLGSPLRAAS